MTKHSGINATRDVLKDQLALAASEIERLNGRAAYLSGLVDHFAARADEYLRLFSAELPVPASSPWPIRAACVIGFAIGLFVGVVL